MKKLITLTKKTVLLATTFFALSVPASVLADQILTFEGFNDWSVLTNQYAGINFQGATILQKGGSLSPNFPPHSGVNVIYNPVGPMELVFSNPISYFSGYLTYNSGMHIDGYDSINVLIDTANGSWTQNYQGSGHLPNELIKIEASDITRVVLTGGSGNNFTLDDVMFSGSVDVNNPVPEPSTMLLLGGGLAGLAFWRRKKTV